MSQTIIMAGVGAEDEFVECARPGLKAKGKLYRKQVLHFGSFQHPNIPGRQITVDDDFADSLIRNFGNGVCDIVQVPIVDGQNKHTEDPTRNLGQVIDLEKTDKGIYAIVDARHKEYADELGKTLIGASAMMNLDYTDTRTGSHCGPTLLHLAITNRPYITNLEDFEEIVSASADTTDDNIVLLGAINEKEQPMTKEELIAALKADHNIDVEALQTAAENTTQLSNVLGDEVSVEDVANAVLELSAKNEEATAKIAALEAKNNELVLSRAGDEIDSLIQAGRILPKQRESMLKLSVADRATFEELLPEESIVSLSEKGVTKHEDTRGEKVKEDMERYLQMIGAAKDSE